MHFHYYLINKNEKQTQYYTDTSWSHKPIEKSDTRSQDQYPNTHIHDPLSLSPLGTRDTLVLLTNTFSLNIIMRPCKCIGAVVVVIVW